MKRLAILLSLFCAVLATGCVKEDLAACRPNGSFRLLFSYKGDGQAEILPQKIGNVRVYVFDAADRFVCSEHVDRAALAAQPAVGLDLPAGAYRVVSVGNYCDMTTIEGLDVGSPCSMESVLLAHPCAFDGGTITGTDSLYMAINRIEVPAAGTSQATAQFAASHFDIDVEVRGVDAAATTLNLCHPYRHVNFNNIPCGSTCTYCPETVAGGPAGTTLAARFNVPRFSPGEPVTLDIVGPAGRVIHTVDMERFIADAGIDLSRQEVLIPILVEFTSVGISVSIPGWASETIKPEF